MTPARGLSFWEHLDVLRKVFFRCLAVWLAGTVLAFCFKDFLFNIIFAPSSADFVVYRLMCRLSAATGLAGICPDEFSVAFINTELAAQFMTHMKISLWAGFVIVFPYVVVQLYGFVSPALYEKERKHSVSAIAVGTALFGLGVLLNYFVIFPFSFRFLGTYQVSAEVVNQIALSSYISTFLMLSLLMGLMFEIPVLAFFLAKLGVVTSAVLKKFRKHALVAICIVAAVITPTGDMVTLMLVTMPIYLLYELSIVIVRVNEKKEKVDNSLNTSLC